MPTRKLLDVQFKIMDEGLGYTVSYYYGRDLDCEDNHLNKLWAKAYDSMEELQNYLDTCNSHDS